MNATESFTTTIKKIRERNRLTASQLADECKLHLSQIYKMESGQGGKIDTVRQAYHWLCANEREWANLLVKWALAQDKGRTKMYEAVEAAAMLNEAPTSQDTDQSPRIKQIHELVNSVAKADLALLEEWISEFKANPHARSMARAFLNGLRQLRGASNDSAE